MKDKVLIIAKTSDYSETGFYRMNRYVLNSSVLASSFSIYNFFLISTKSGYFHKWIKFIKYILRLRKTLLLFKPELIYFTISPKNAFYRDLAFVIIIKLVGNSKIVYHLHGKGIRESRASKVNNFLYNFAFRDVYIICLSKLLKYDFAGLPILTYFVLGNAIENSIPPLPKEKNNRIPQIIFLSNFIRSKGIYDLLEALSILKSKNIVFKCILTGQEYDVTYKDIDKFLEEKELKHNVLITGPKYKSEKTQLLLASDIFVHPTLEDVWGLVILEAMQAGMPVISTNEGAIPEIINHGETGFVVKKNNPLELAKKIEILLNDNDLRLKMGHAGRKKFEKNYTIEKFESKLKDIFIEILQK